MNVITAIPTTRILRSKTRGVQKNRIDTTLTERLAHRHAHPIFAPNQRIFHAGG
jgi:hypothetical protein